MKRAILLIGIACVGMGLINYRKSAVESRSRENKPQAFSLENAEANPLACALLIAKSLDRPDHTETDALYEIAGKCVEAGRHAEALQITQTLDAARRAYVWAAIANRQTQDQQTDAAVVSLSHALQAAQSMDNAYSQADVFEFIATAYIKLDQHDQALQVLQATRDVDRKADVLNQAAGQYLEAGDNPSALEMLSRSLQVALNELGDSPFKDRWLGRIAANYAAAGQCEKAIAITRIMTDENEKYWPVIHIVHHYAAAAQYEQAFQVANTPTDFRERAEMLAEIAVQYAKVGHHDESLKTFNQAVKLASKSSPDEATKGWALVEIAGQYAEAGFYDEAFGLANKCGALRDEAFLKIADQYAQAGGYQQAFELIRTTANTLGNCDKQRLLLTIVERYLEGGQCAAAIEVAQTMEEACARIDWPIFYRPEALAKIAVKYAEMGQYEQALEVTQTIATPLYNARAAAQIARKCAQAGRQDKASEIFLRALQVAQATEFTYDKAIALAEIGISFAEAGMRLDDAAKHVLRQIVEAHSRKAGVSLSSVYRSIQELPL